MNPSRLKPIVNNFDLWNLFDAYLAESYTEAGTQMDLTDNPNKLYQLQGKRKFITELRNLKDVVNNAK